jgi:hypothetical protein
LAGDIRKSESPARAAVNALRLRDMTRTIHKMEVSDLSRRSQDYRETLLKVPRNPDAFRPDAFSKTMPG